MTSPLLTNFITVLQMLNNALLEFWPRWAIKCKTSIYLPWCMKRNWPQSFFRAISFWFFMFIVVLRTLRECFIAIYYHFAKGWNSLLWFAEINERLNNLTQEYLYSKLQCNVIQCYAMSPSSNWYSYNVGSCRKHLPQGILYSLTAPTITWAKIYATLLWSPRKLPRKKLISVIIV